MYLQIPNGASQNIQGLECWIPEEGYVYNISTKKYEYRGIYKRSDIVSEQYWDRIPSPPWYAAVIKEWNNYDKKKKEDDEEFYNEKLEEYKKQEWDRRLNGFWFMNNGKAVFITGSHYMYMQHWVIDIGYPKFRFTDSEYFYFLQYCIEDPECMGMLEITKRRFGKTFRGGLFVIEYPTRTKMTNGGIQSKTGKDARKVFSKAIISPFKKLPKFFRPEYDMSGGLTPKTELRLEKTNVRGKKAEENLDKDELGSLIDFETADTIAYDGQKLQRYFCDEWCKTTEVNVYDRHEVIRYCLMDDSGKIIGKALYSSTVEKLDTDRDGIQQAAKTLWDDSDQLNRKENGRTASGLYRFFMTADRGRNIDIYGISDEAKTIKEILADRETVKHNPRSLTKRIKKEARTIEEAFSDDDDDCIFNLPKINARKISLKENPVYKRTIQYYRDLDQVVRWRDVDPNKTELYWSHTPECDLSQPKEPRHFLQEKIRMPSRAEKLVIGIDGYSNNQGGKTYGSKLSGWMFLKFDTNNPEKTGKFIGHIYGRPNEKGEMHNQILLAAEFHGSPAYYEFVADDYWTYFKDRGRIGYLALFPKISIDPIKLKKDTEGKDRHRGFPTTEFALTKQNDAMMSYIENYSEKIDYMELLEDLPKFRPYKRGPFDRTVSAMITLVSSMEPVYKPQRPKEPLIKVYSNTTIMTLN